MDTLISNKHGKRIGAYALACALITVALLLHDSTLLILFMLAIGVTAWFGGLGPGLAATVMSLPIINYVHTRGTDLLFLGGSNEFRVSSYLVLGLLISVITVRLRRAQQKRSAELLERARDALRANEARYRELVQNAGSVIQRWRCSDGTLTFFNEYAQELFGYTAEEVIGKNVMMMVPDHDTKGRDLSGLVRGIVEHPEKYQNFINQNVCRDGRRIWINWTNKPIYDEQGRMVEILAVGTDVTERSLYEMEVARSRAMLADAERLSHTGAWEWDTASDVWTFSEEWLAIHGCPGKTLTPADLLSIAHPDDRARIEEAFARLRDGISPYEMDHRIVRPDTSETRVVRAHGQFVADSGGKVVKAYGFAQDITDQTRAKEQLEQAHQKLQNMIDSITDGLIVIGRDWVIQYISETGARMVGMRREDLIGKNEWAMFPHAVNTKFFEEFNRALETGQPGVFEEFYPGPLNMWIECHCYPSADGLSVYFRDISDRKKAEARLRRFYDSGMLGVIYWTMDGKITDANDKFLQMVGYSREEMENGAMDWARMTPAEFREMDEFAIGEMLATGIDTPYEKEYIRKDGSRIPILIGTALLDQAKREGVGFVLDITERKRISRELVEANNRLVEADRRKDEFLAMLAHELRNPLAPIRYAAQMLKIDAHTREQVQKQREIIDRQVSHMGRLLDDLLEVSRITRGKIQLRREVVDLRAVAGHAIDSLRPMIEGRGQHLDFGPADAPVMVHGDPTRLEQVVRNLLHNANKYTEEGGRINVSVARDDSDPGRGAVVRVFDDGIGIPPEMLANIFDPFVQVETSLARTQGGLGIGLSMVQNLVRMHGGDVSANSGGMGKGSEFTVRLPLVAREIEAPRPEPAPPVAIDENRPSRVLVVDDNEDAASSLGELLSLWGHNVQTACDGRHALAAAQRHKPQIVLLDIGLPGMDGYEVARRMREEPEMADAYLVALTGYGQDEDRRRAKEAGFDQHLTKPVDLQQLQVILNERKAA